MFDVLWRKCEQDAEEKQGREGLGLDGQGPGIQSYNARLTHKRWEGVMKKALHWESDGLSLAACPATY